MQLHLVLPRESQPTNHRPHEHTAATCNTKREVAEAELVVGQPSKDLERHRKFTLAVLEAKQAWAWNGSIAAATLFGNGQGGGGIGTSGGGTKPISPPLPLPMAPIPPPVINGATAAMASSNPNSNDAGKAYVGSDASTAAAALAFAAVDAPTGSALNLESADGNAVSDYSLPIMIRMPASNPVSVIDAHDNLTLESKFAATVTTLYPLLARHSRHTPSLQ